MNVNTILTKPTPQPHVPPAETRSTTPRMPEPSNLTRRELRRIVLDILG